MSSSEITFPLLILLNLGFLPLKIWILNIYYFSVYLIRGCEFHLKMKKKKYKKPKQMKAESLWTLETVPIGVLKYHPISLIGLEKPILFNIVFVSFIHVSVLVLTQ